MATEASGKLHQVIIVTGVGGGGKTTALRALEDIGFYCIDNLPVVLLETFLELVATKPGINRVALVVDARERSFLDEAPDTLNRVMAAGVPIELLFLDADDNALVRRYSETRRQHPLSNGGSVRDGIAEERRRLVPLRALAHASINSNKLSPHQLKRLISDRYRRNLSSRLAITMMSFGFKHGVPVEADLVFDVRFLANPYFTPDLRELLGTDTPVKEFVLAAAETAEFLRLLEEMLRFLLPAFEREGKRYLTIALGCTGGRHRSVVLAEELRSRLEGDYTPRTVHRDIER